MKKLLFILIVCCAGCVNKNNPDIAGNWKCTSVRGSGVVEIDSVRFRRWIWENGVDAVGLYYKVVNDSVYCIYPYEPVIKVNYLLKYNEDEMIMSNSEDSIVFLRITSDDFIEFENNIKEPANVTLESDTIVNEDDTIIRQQIIMNIVDTMDRNKELEK